MMATTEREAVLTAALAAVNGDRDETYGRPEDNFHRIALMWSAYLGIAITPADVAAMNVLQKVGRLVNTPRHRDSWVDIAGYAACGGEVA
jgi:hypothetical protein